MILLNIYNYICIYLYITNYDLKGNLEGDLDGDIYLKTLKWNQITSYLAILGIVWLTQQILWPVKDQKYRIFSKKYVNKFYLATKG